MQDLQDAARVASSHVAHIWDDESYDRGPEGEDRKHMIEIQILVSGALREKTDAHIRRLKLVEPKPQQLKARLHLQVPAAGLRMTQTQLRIKPPSLLSASSSNFCHYWS